jgi:hypothetical protein
VSTETRVRFAWLEKLRIRIDHWMCDTMDWHRPHSMDVGFDGASAHSNCKYCGRKVLQDSQGNWFAAFRSTRS